MALLSLRLVVRHQHGGLRHLSGIMSVFTGQYFKGLSGGGLGFIAAALMLGLITGGLDGYLRALLAGGCGLIALGLVINYWERRDSDDGQ